MEIIRVPGAAVRVQRVSNENREDLFEYELAYAKDWQLQAFLDLGWEADTGALQGTVHGQWSTLVIWGRREPAIYPDFRGDPRI